MTALELIALARRQADDTTAPYLWSDVEWLDYANEAEREACRRAHLIVDSASSVCRSNLAVGASTIIRSPLILRIRRIKVGSQTAPLIGIDVRDLDVLDPGWEARTGSITHYVRNYSSGSVRFYRIATAVDTVRMTVIRLPLADMTVTDEPEIPTTNHRRLVDYMLALAYQKQDVETLNPKKEQESLIRFEQSFGSERSAKEEAWAEANYDYSDDQGEF